MTNQKRKKVYLAGGIEKAPDGGKKWRQDMSRFLDRELGHQSFDPTINELTLLNHEERIHLRNWKCADTPRFKETVRRIIRHDLDTLTNQCDYIICLWDEYATNGGGTYGEMTLAFRENIPVYMVTPLPLRSISGWIIACTDRIFCDFNSLRSFLRTEFGPKPANPDCK